MADKIRVAILGGGMGGLATAWRLSEPAHRGRFDVTVYQRDWLLGGKGASTRNVHHDLRIEEHGIHLLLGFYDTALHLLRQVYEEVQGTPGISGFDDAIEGWDYVWMADEHPAGTWNDAWRVRFPSDPDVSPGTASGPATIAELVAAAAERFRRALNDLYSLAGSPVAPDAGRIAPLIDSTLRDLRSGSRNLATRVFDVLAGLIEGLVRASWLLARPLLQGPSARHAWIAVYLLGTNLTGLLRDRILLDGTAGIDSLDYRAWLRRHEAVSCEPHLSFESPPVRALYDLSFSRHVGLAAGVSLYAIARMLFGYRGHFMYKMKAGMGEVVFAPLYLALRRRGVSFRFCHEVLELTAGRDATGSDVIEAIRMQSPRSAKNEAFPLVVAGGNDGVQRPAWPAARPAFAGGEPLPETLQRGRPDGFDVAVLAIPPSGLPPAMVGSLRAARPRFATMIDHATHVATQSMQLWMTRTGVQIGGPPDQPAMVISDERPFNSRVDMSHLLASEGGPAQVRSVHYLCDELRSGEGTDAAAVERNAVAWIAQNVARVWPGFSWQDLYDPSGRAGMGRMGAQYFRANHDGSDRYVTVGPGSLRHRLDASGSGFRNLALAGDWVRTILSAGCLEAATTAGLEAGQAIVDGIVSA